MTPSKRLTGKQYLSIIACVLLTAMVSIYTMATYVKGPLNGNFDHFLMQADLWGVPDKIKQHGITPLYLDDWNAGWDGQFYYYIANDIFAQHDTASHIDSDAYRYQRVGIPILSKIFSLLLLQEWVSPFLYYLTHFLLILLGTAIAARFFTKQGVSAYWIIPWSVGMGTQITLLNGLPDGAADALLIIAMIAAYEKKYIAYTVSITFACLSREAYVAFPAILIFAEIIERYRNKTSFTPRGDFLLLLSPLVVFFAWHIFIRLKFIHTPGEQSPGILGAPLKSLFLHLLPGLQGHYPNMQAGWFSYISAIGLIFFCLLLILTAYTVTKTHPLRTTLEGKLVSNTASAFTLVLCLLYSCFGDTVIWNFTGYMKAAGLFLFCIPFIATTKKLPLRKSTFAFFIIITVFFCWQGWTLRVNQPPIKYKFDSNCNHLKIITSDSCFEKFVWRGDELLGLVGEPVNNERIAVQGKTRTGYISYGPYIELLRGNYNVTLSISGEGANLGYTEIAGIDANNNAITFSKQALKPGKNIDINTTLHINDTSIRNLEVRTWYQSGNLSIHKITIERTPN
ncbi:hypothetical protein [Pseudomonas mohnii]